MASRGPDKGYDRLMKLLLVGDSGVGKSCLLLRFVDDKFNPSFITTIGIDFKIRTIELNGKKIKLQIWDTAGQERFRTITTAYYRGAMGIIIVYDVTDSRTFQSVRDWYSTVNQHATDNAQICIVGNKCDDDSSRQVSTEEGQELANELGVSFLEASAKSGINVDAVFFDLSRLIQSKVETNDTETTGGVNIASGNNAKTSGCC